MEPNAKSPKLEDVAAKAGVSTATISRYFNNPEKVAKSTADRIRAVVAETGYIPNMLAGGLASSKSRLVAVLIPHLTNSIFNGTIEAMVGELSAAGSVVMLGLTGSKDENADELIKAALARRADAIITTGKVSADIREVLRRSNTPVIEIWDLPEDPIDVAVGFSHLAAGRDIARFLKTRGYLRPHIITGDGDRARVRRSGILQEWDALGGQKPTEDTVDIPSRFGHARGAFATLKRLKKIPDVVVCGSDYLAQGLIVEARASGLNVPDDLGVFGFGNSPIAGEMRPTITTIDIDGARIAREAIALLRRRAEGEALKRHCVDVGFRLIARESA